MENRSLKMKERPVAERPYEKCILTGPESLTDGELLAVILRCGTKNCSALEMAWKILEKHPVYKGLEGLHHMDRKSLMEIPGVGNVKATEILCILELSKRLSKVQARENLDISSPDFIAKYYMEEMCHLKIEKVLLLLLDEKHQLLSELILSTGTSDSALVPVRSIFQEALRNEAAYVILIHNHPSGDPEPGREDLVLTRQIVKAGQMVEVPLLDHIIIGDHTFISMREKGLI